MTQAPPPRVDTRDNDFAMKGESRDAATPASSRPMVTIETVQKIERLLAAGLPHRDIAAQCGVTTYVVGVIANDENRPRKAPPRRGRNHGVVYDRYWLSAVDVWRIQRMLEAGFLTTDEIGREVGVGSDTVIRIAKGLRPAITIIAAPVSDGEAFLPVPIRCKGCGGLISVTPCRVCEARRAREKTTS